jgi:hypothetical protein
VAPDHAGFALVVTARQTTRGLPQVVRIPAPSRPAPAPGAPRRVAAAGLPSRWPVYLVLYVLAATISAITVYKGLQPNDEGLMLQAARRIAQGQVPYSDFWWYYPPGQSYLLGGLWSAFGPSLITWRVVRVLADAAVAVLAYALARREAGPKLSLAAWAAATLAMAQLPQPHPFPIALALALASLLLFPRRPVIAGIVAGVCALWRLEFAGYLAVGVVLALAVRPVPGPDRVRAAGRFVGTAVLAGTALFAPVVAAAGLGKAWDLVVRYPVVDFAKYQSLPFPIDYDGPLNTSSVGGFLSDSFENMLRFYLPLALVIGLAAALLSLLLRARRDDWAWLASAVFALGMTHYLIVRPDEFHTAPLVVLVSVLAAWAVAHARLGMPARRRRKVHATMPFARGAAGRHPGQVKPAEPLLERREGQLPRLTPFVAASGARPRRLLALVPAIVAAAALAYVIAEGFDAKLLALRDDTAPLHLSMADGVQANPRSVGPLERAVRFVDQRVPPGRPIYVTTRRSDLVTSGNPLFYVLALRNNPTRYDIAAPGVVTSAPVQNEIVGDLERTQTPIVVRYVSPVTTAPEPNRAGQSTGVTILDRYLSQAYRPAARFGYYVILERKPPPRRAHRRRR